MRASRAVPRPTWPSTSRRRRRGKRPTRACRRTADSASPPSTTSSASSAKRACIRSRRSRRTWYSPTWPSTCSGCPDRSDDAAARWHHRGRSRARDRGAILHAPARRSRRARNQDRAAASRRFRPRYDARDRGLASHFVWTNRSKESLTLDVKHPQAQSILRRLILEHADVVVQNLAPGAAARLGLVHEALARDKPSLIVCDISGYGSDGPYRDKKAYDLLIQSEAGFLSVTGTQEEPTKAGCSIADIAAAMYAYTNILAALIERGKTGVGCRIDVSML